MDIQYYTLSVQHNNALYNVSEMFIMLSLWHYHHIS